MISDISPLHPATGARRSPTRSGWSRRRLLAAIAVTPLVAGFLAACGDDRVQDAAGSPLGDTTAPDTSTPPAESDGGGAGGAIDHPTGADELVVRIEHSGGFVMADVSFAQLPDFLLLGDGSLVRPGPQIMIYPGPLLPALERVPLGQDAVQQVLALAAEHHLFQDFDDRSYTDVVADAGYTVVTIQAQGETYVQRAYALGVEPPGEAMPNGTVPADIVQRRADLAAFVEAVTSGSWADAGAGGEVYSPDQWVIDWMDADPSGYTEEPKPTVIPWPEALGEPTDGCTVLDDATVQQVFADATQLTFYERPDGTTVRPLVRPLLPGSESC